MTQERDQKIRDRAHAIWLEEGSPTGRHEEHWERATQEVDAASGPATAKSERKPRAKAAASSSKASPPVAEEDAPTGKSPKRQKRAGKTTSAPSARPTGAQKAV